MWDRHFKFYESGDILVAKPAVRERVERRAVQPAWVATPISTGEWAPGSARPFQLIAGGLFSGVESPHSPGLGEQAD